MLQVADFVEGASSGLVLVAFGTSFQFNSWLSLEDYQGRLWSAVSLTVTATRQLTLYGTVCVLPSRAKPATRALPCSCVYLYYSCTRLVLCLVTLQADVPYRPWASLVVPNMCCAAELSAAFTALAPIRVLWHINTQVTQI